MAARRVVIGLLWHSMTSDNLGVGALTLANIAIVRAAAARAGVVPHFLVLGWREPRVPYAEMPDVEMVPLRTRDLMPGRGGLPRAIRRCDMVLDIGAGDSFADIYGVSRSLKILGSKVLVLAGGRPLVLSPQTVGPFGRGWIRFLARQVMDRARAVVTRDAPTTRFLSGMGVRARVIEAADVALRLPFEAPPPRPEGSRPRIGLNVSGLLLNGGYTRDNQFGLTVDYARLTRQMLHWATDAGGTGDGLGAEVHLIGHVQSDALEVEDDLRAAARLAAEFPGVILAPRFASPVAAKSYIAGMDFMIGARMHACIAAFSAGVPVLPVAYSRKFAGVFGSLGYTLAADLRSNTEEEIMAMLRSAYAGRAALAGEMARGMAEGLARLGLYEDLLVELLSRPGDAHDR